VEKTRSTRANVRLDSPQLTMPQRLCREFRLIGVRNGLETELLSVTDNRKRAYHITANQNFDSLVLIPIRSWGNSEMDLISFDFRT
jgi:hypothetical protein